MVLTPQKNKNKKTNNNKTAKNKQKQQQQQQQQKPPKKASGSLTGIDLRLTACETGPYTTGFD